MNLKNTLHEIYESQTTFLIEQKQCDKSKELANLFNKLLDSLDHVLHSTPRSVDNAQINNILIKIKTDLNTWRL